MKSPSVTTVTGGADDDNLVIVVAASDDNISPSLLQWTIKLVYNSHKPCLQTLQLPISALVKLYNVVS